MDEHNERMALESQHFATIDALSAEYGDGYAAGMVDGIRDLHKAITDAIESAAVGQRLPAVERVLAEYEAMYLKQ